MLPRTEIETLHRGIVDAEELAVDQDIEAGYRCLLAGLHRAREAEEDGEPWGVDLVTAWHEACEAYAERYGISRA